MSDRTSIEWTRGDDGTPGATWNPVTGCVEVSPGCDHCYAKTFAERWRGTPGHYFEHGFDVQLRPDKLDQPLRWRRPRRIFVNSMSDLFHDSVPDDYIGSVFDVMARAEHHTFQILTKRHARMRSLLRKWEQQAADDPGLHPNYRHAAFRRHDKMWCTPQRWPLPNVWLGVSTEDQRWADIRIPALLDTPAAVRFVSAEPLLGSIDLTPWIGCPHDSLSGVDMAPLDSPVKRWRCDQCCASVLDGTVTNVGLHWVIVGGESGPGARPMHPDWARSLRDQCQAAGVAFLFKQWGEYIPEFVEVYGSPTIGMRRVGKKAAGRKLDGRTWDQYPEVAR